MSRSSGRCPEPGSYNVVVKAAVVHPKTAVRFTRQGLVSGVVELSH
jgi:hypothetical protein